MLHPTLDLSTVELPISPSPDAAPFWDAVQRHELLLPACPSCGPFWYPRNLCPRCGSREVTWTPAEGGGVVHAFCVHHQATVAHLRDRVPFATVLVELAEGPRVMGLYGGDPATVACDDPVAVDFAESASGFVVPIFIPAAQPFTREER